MKKYKKNEIKQILENEFQDVTLSEKLKVKTLQKVKNYSKPSFYWLRNCAAVLIVSCLCLSLYLHESHILENNFEDEKAQTQEYAEDIVSGSISIQNLNESNLLRSSTTDTTSGFGSSANGFSSVKKENLRKSSAVIQDMLSDESVSEYLMMNSIEDNDENDTDLEIGDNVEELLKMYPKAEKQENGYSVSIDGDVAFYEVVNGTITNILLENLQ